MPAQAVPLVFEGPTWIDGSIDGSILPALSENWVQYGTAWYSTSKSSIKLIFDHHFPREKSAIPSWNKPIAEAPRAPRAPSSHRVPVPSPSAAALVLPVMLWHHMAPICRKIRDGLLLLYSHYVVYRVVSVLVLLVQ